MQRAHCKPSPLEAEGWVRARDFGGTSLQALTPALTLKGRVGSRHPAKMGMPQQVLHNALKQLDNTRGTYKENPRCSYFVSWILSIFFEFNAV